MSSKDYKKLVNRLPSLNSQEEIQGYVENSKEGTESMAKILFHIMTTLAKQWNIYAKNPEKFEENNLTALRRYVSKDCEIDDLISKYGIALSMLIFRNNPVEIGLHNIKPPYLTQYEPCEYFKIDCDIIVGIVADKDCEVVMNYAGQQTELQVSKNIPKLICTGKNILPVIKILPLADTHIYFPDGAPDRCDLIYAMINSDIRKWYVASSIKLKIGNKQFIASRKAVGLGIDSEKHDSLSLYYRKEYADYIELQELNDYLDLNMYATIIQRAWRSHVWQLKILDQLYTPGGLGWLRHKHSFLKSQ